MPSLPAQAQGGRIEWKAPAHMKTDDYKNPKDMTPEEREALPISNIQKEGFGARGVRGDDLMFFTDSQGVAWMPRLGRNGWYRQRA